MGRDHVYEVDNFCDRTWLQFRGFAVHNKAVMCRSTIQNLQQMLIVQIWYAGLNICSSVLTVDVNVQLLIT